MSVLALLWIALLGIGAVATELCGHGYKCHSYRSISKHQTYEIRRYKETLWITWEEHGGITTLTDFPFLVEYTDRVLSRYFEGSNYFGQKLERTTPLRIDVQIFNLQRPRRVSFPVHIEMTDGVPAPFHPLFISQVSERYVYVRRVPADMKYIALLHAAAEFMADLAMNKLPFEKDQVNFVLYSRPMAPDTSDLGEGEVEGEAKEGATAVMNEIWIGRTVSQYGSGHGSAYGGDSAYGGWDGGFGGGSGFSSGGVGFDAREFSGRGGYEGAGFDSRDSYDLGGGGHHGGGLLFQNHDDPLSLLAEDAHLYFDYSE